MWKLDFVWETNKLGYFDGKQLAPSTVIYEDAQRNLLKKFK